MDRFDLGAHVRAISTPSAQTQRWFNLGLNWCYGFNHEEGAACFARALDHDPTCVMAHWGAAYAVGPFYNNVWRQFSLAEADVATATASHHIAQARAHANTATDLENQLVEALWHRSQRPHAVAPEDFDRWDDDYMDAMRKLYATAPDDHDVMALFAEAIMTRKAWKLWDVARGTPAKGSYVEEVLAVIERSITLNDAAALPQHPSILHLHIHATEMSPAPEQALRSADILGKLCPDAGHLNHMPGHTYMLCGLYEKAKRASEKAIAADDLYVAHAGAFNFYTTARCHDLHLMMHACMFLGQHTPAQAAADKVRATLSSEVLSIQGRPQMAATLEGYHAMTIHVAVRFGRWQDIIDTPLPDDPALYCVTTAMLHYAKGVAHAALAQFEAADDHRSAFHASLKRVPAVRAFFNNRALATLGVAEKMLDGELAYHRGDHAAAFTALRDAVARDDALNYTEPAAWMHPPRHALAALLAAQGHWDEAEDVYRTDLGLNDKLHRCAQHPDNVWALHGLVECLQQRAEAEELPGLRAKLAQAQANTDVPITAACLCRAARKDAQ